MLSSRSDLTLSVQGSTQKSTVHYGGCESELTSSWVDFNPAVKRRTADHSNSDLQTFINLFKSCFGPGCLALPLAVSNAGIIPGVVGLIVIGIISIHCMLQLLDITNVLYKRQGCTSLNYAEVASSVTKDFTGKKRAGVAFGVLVNVFLILTQFGFCTVYFVFMGHNLSEVFCSAFGVHLDRRVWIAITILPVLAAISIKNLDNIVPFSMVSNILLVYCMAVIVYAEINAMFTHNEIEKADVLKANSTVELFATHEVYNHLPLFFSSAIYSYEMIGMVLPIENRMQHPSHAKPLFTFTLGIAMIVYTVFGTFGYLVYGAQVKGSITLNLISDHMGTVTLFLLVKLFFSYIIFVAFMLQFYVPMDFLEPIVYHKLLKVDHLTYRFPRCHGFIQGLIQNGFRVVIVLLIATVSLTLPDLQDLITLIGALASSSLALIFPPVLEIMCYWRNRDQHRWLGCCRWPVWVVKDLLIALLGVVGMVLGVYTSLNNISQNFLRPTDNNCTVYYTV